MLIRSTAITIIIAIHPGPRMPVWAVLGTRLASLLLEEMSRTLLMCPFIPHVKHVLLIGQPRVECSSRAPQVKHYQSSHKSGLDTGDMRYTHDLYGAFVRPMFAFRAASFANEARLLLVLRRCLKIAHHVGCLCEMSDEFMVAEGDVRERTRRSS